MTARGCRLIEQYEYRSFGKIRFCISLYFVKLLLSAQRDRNFLMIKTVREWKYVRDNVITTLWGIQREEGGFKCLQGYTPMASRIHSTTHATCIPFMDAFSHLHKRVRPSVRQSLRPSQLGLRARDGHTLLQRFEDVSKEQRIDSRGCNVDVIWASNEPMLGRPFRLENEFRKRSEKENGYIL